MQSLRAAPTLPVSLQRTLRPGPVSFPRLLFRTCPLPCPGLRSKPTVASAVKEDRKTGGGRKGEGRTGSSRSPSGTTSGRTTSGRKDPSSSSSGHTTSGSSRQLKPTQAPPPPQRKQQQQPPNQQQQQPRKGVVTNKASASQLDQLMRKHPLFSRFYDTTLLLGDAVMVLATEASSNRIEWSSFPALVAVLLVCWLAAGAANGDYSPAGSRAHEDVPWQLSMLGPTFGAVLGATLTWAFASTAAVAAYAGLVAANLLDAAPVVEGLNSDDLSPQLEVIVALLITMTCWRGIVSKLRPTIPGGKD